MAKNSKKNYTCIECGSISKKWAGQCADCKAWNSLQETIVTPKVKENPRFSGYTGNMDNMGIQSLSKVSVEENKRTDSGLSELNRVLGGGLVQGSVILIGGDPGIGKSTLLIQTLAHLSTQMKALYISGEESAQQISLRAQRLELPIDGLRLLTETCIEQILPLALQEKPQVMVLDSIQTIYTAQLQSAPGSISQVRESTAQIVRYAKQTGTTIFLVGHVTKDGSLAGPRVLEHMVDTVLYFEGESGSQFRLIRAMKNRFGAVNELGVFAMTDKGLREVANPSAIFLSRHQQEISGSAILVTREGTRPLLVEVQALVDESPAPNPRRVSLGLEQNRLAMLLAVLHRHAGVAMYNQDVYTNVVGGVRITETAADLAVLLAVLSSYRDKPLPQRLIVFGEVGLAGEIRPVPNGLDRLKEAAKHGFERAIVPIANVPKDPIEGLTITGVQRLSEVVEQL